MPPALNIVFTANFQYSLCKLISIEYSYVRLPRKNLAATCLMGVKIYSIYIVNLALLRNLEISGTKEITKHLSIYWIIVRKPSSTSQQAKNNVHLSRLRYCNSSNSANEVQKSEKHNLAHRAGVWWLLLVFMSRIIRSRSLVHCWLTVFAFYWRADNRICT